MELEENMKMRTFKLHIVNFYNTYLWPIITLQNNSNDIQYKIYAV